MRILRLVLYWLIGRRYFWQYYTNVTWATCEDCLRLHGRIAPSPTAFPGRGDGCPRELLRFPVWELFRYREKAQRMRRVAEEELRRRRLFSRASEILEESPGEALKLFDRAGEIEVYLPELERLAEEHGDFLSRNPEVRDRLRSLFAAHWQAKFGKSRYAAWPEGMRAQHERYGVQRIEELFPKP